MKLRSVFSLEALHSVARVVVVIKFHCSMWVITWRILKLANLKVSLSVSTSALKYTSYPALLCGVSAREMGLLSDVRGRKKIVDVLVTHCSKLWWRGFKFLQDFSLSIIRDYTSDTLSIDVLVFYLTNFRSFCAQMYDVPPCQNYKEIYV